MEPVFASSSGEGIVLGFAELAIIFANRPPRIPECCGKVLRVRHLAVSTDRLSPLLTSLGITGRVISPGVDFMVGEATGWSVKGPDLVMITEQSVF